MQVSINEASQRLLGLVAAAEQGEDILITRDGEPVARLVKYQSRRVKPPGAWKDKVEYSKDCNTPDTNRIVEALVLGDDDAVTT